jgi:hypothetical protein
MSMSHDDYQEAQDKIRNLQKQLDQYKARYHSMTGVYYINGRKFVPVEMFDQVVEVLEMVQDNTKMPHQHTDPQLRLYCLAERAEEVLKKVEIK